ncbi:hypothetical protein Efla_001402 [Eimeria flavescens]
MSLTRRSTNNSRRSTAKKVMSLKASSDEEGWVREKGKYLDLSYRVEKDTAVSIKVLSILNESDLAGNWAPMFKSAEKVYVYSRASQLIRQIFDYPVLGAKETIMFSFGVNALEECGAVIICCRSPPEDATEFMGKAIPKRGKVPRIQSANLVFLLYPISEGRQTTLELYGCFSHGLRYVPTRIITYVVKKVCQHFSTSIYKQRIEENPEFYCWMRDCIEDFVAGDAAPHFKQLESISLCSFNYEEFQELKGGPLEGPCRQEGLLGALCFEGPQLEFRGRLRRSVRALRAAVSSASVPGGPPDEGALGKGPREEGPPASNLRTKALLEDALSAQGSVAEWILGGPVACLGPLEALAAPRCCCGLCASIPQQGPLSAPLAAAAAAVAAAAADAATAAAAAARECLIASSWSGEPLQGEERTAALLGVHAAAIAAAGIAVPAAALAVAAAAICFLLLEAFTFRQRPLFMSLGRHSAASKRRRCIRSRCREQFGLRLLKAAERSASQEDRGWGQGDDHPAGAADWGAPSLHALTGCCCDAAAATCGDTPAAAARLGVAAEGCCNPPDSSRAAVASGSFARSARRNTCCSGRLCLHLIRRSLYCCCWASAAAGLLVGAAETREQQQQQQRHHALWPTRSLTRRRYTRKGEQPGFFFSQCEKAFLLQRLKRKNPPECWDRRVDRAPSTATAATAAAALAAVAAAAAAGSPLSAIAAAAAALFS